MTKTIKLMGALAALSVSGSLFAQTTTNPTPDLGAGLLGHRYAEAGFEYTDVNHTPTDLWDTSLLINNPIAPHIDVSLDYTYSWAKGFPAHDNDVNINGIYYNDFGAFKPYVGASLGYEWTHATFTSFDNEEDAPFTVTADNNEATFGARIGTEYQVSANFVVTGEVQFSSDFKRNNDGQSWDGSLAGHYWFTKQIAAYARVSWLEGGDFAYGTGVTYKF